MATNTELFFSQINDTVVHSKDGRITARVIGANMDTKKVNVGGKWIRLTRFLYDYYIPDGVTDPRIPDSRASNFPVTYALGAE